MNTGFYDIFIKEKDFIDTLIRGELESGKEKYYPGLYEAMEYSLFPGGKRVRPVVLKWCAELGEPESAAVAKCAAAVEYIHTYSLIHDDLPAMDDDDMRRGRASSHRVFGEAMAVLAGDALLTEAFALLGQTGDARLSAVLAEDAGAGGMVGGQAADITGCPDIGYVNELKTARLFRAAAVMGGIAGGLDDVSLDKLSVYGINLGKAFQLRDDVLDEEAPDNARAAEKAFLYTENAKDAVCGFRNHEKLAAIADYMVKRER